MPNIRTISREKLSAVFKTDELVKLMESILYQVGTAIPADTSSVQDNLDSHINNPVAAHMATAIGFAPAGGLSATDVQAAIVEVASMTGSGTLLDGGNASNPVASIAFTIDCGAAS